MTILDDMDCANCGTPLEVERTFAMAGAGFGPPGTECVVVYARVGCALGHHYDVEVSNVEIRP